MQGFETRGTPIADGLTAWSNLLDGVSHLGPLTTNPLEGRRVSDFFGPPPEVGLGAGGAGDPGGFSGFGGPGGRSRKRGRRRKKKRRKNKVGERPEATGEEKKRKAPCYFWSPEA